MTVICTLQLSSPLIPNIHPLANLVSKVTVYSLQVSPALAGGLKPSWISAKLEADVATNLCSRLCTMQAGAPGYKEEYYPLDFWSC